MQPEQFLNVTWMGCVESFAALNPFGESPSTLLRNGSTITYADGSGVEVFARPRALAHVKLKVFKAAL